MIKHKKSNKLKKLDQLLLKFSKEGRNRIKIAHINFLKECKIRARNFIDKGLIDLTNVEIIEKLLVFTFISKALENAQRENKREYSGIETEYILRQIFSIVLSVEFGEIKRWMFWKRKEFNELEREKDKKITFLLKGYYFYSDLKEELSEILREYILLCISKEINSNKKNTELINIEKQLSTKLLGFLKTELDDSLSLVKRNLVFFISISCEEFLLEQLNSFPEVNEEEVDNIKESANKFIFKVLKSIEKNHGYR